MCRSERITDREKVFLIILLAGIMLSIDAFSSPYSFMNSAHFVGEDLQIGTPSEDITCQRPLARNNQ